jgi:hypothetical protein
LPHRENKDFERGKAGSIMSVFAYSGAMPTSTFGYLHDYSCYDGIERRPQNLHTKRDQEG